eukprot:evm.model.scf_1175.3 EVM.evm.TU.scf_1175.3   scf_1175:45511-47906(+)
MPRRCQKIFSARSLPGFLVLCVLPRFCGIPHPLGERQHMPLLALYGTLGAAAVVCFYLALLRIPLGDAYTLFLTNAAGTALLGWLLRVAKINRQLVAGIFLCTVGAVMASHPPFLFGGHQEWDNKRLLGVTLIGAAVLTGSCGFLLLGVIGERLPSVTLMSWIFLVSSLVSVITLSMGFPKPAVVDLGVHEWLLVFVLITVSLSGQFFTTRGVQLCKGPKGATLVTTQVIYSHVLGFVVLSETPSLWVVGGSVVIALGAVLVAKGKDSNAGKGGYVAVGSEDGRGASVLELSGLKTSDGLEQDALGVLTLVRSRSPEGAV